jgi:xanthine dehydrogenase accessory factor
LYRAGFQIVISEIAQPRAIRRTVAFAEAVYQRSQVVEELTAIRCDVSEVDSVWQDGNIPVVVDPQAQLREALKPDALVDAILSKSNVGGTRLDWAPLVIGLGPGFKAGVDCHLVVETLRGHFLGRFYSQGSAALNTGVPGELGGQTELRVIRAPAEGPFVSDATIGSQVSQGQPVGEIGGVPVPAPLTGVLRGLLAPGLAVRSGEKIGDVDPRGRPEYCRYISDKARQVGAGVLAAILWHQSGRSGPDLPPPPA